MSVAEHELAEHDHRPPERPNLLRRVLAGNRSRIGLALVVVMVVIALGGPLVSPHGPSELVGAPYDTTFGVLGTDSLGRDVLSRWLWGGRTLVWMSVAATLLAVTAGTLVGLVAAYSRGVLDTVLMRGVDVLLAVPSVVLVLLVVSVFGTQPWLLVVLVAISQLPSIARVMRGAAVPVVERDFVQWSRAAGVPTRQILLRDVLPNVSSPLLVELGMRLMWCIGLLAGLSFLGYGLQPPAADWGLMINESRTALAVQPWAVIAPVVAIAVFTVGGNLFAEGVSRTMNRTEGEH